MSDATLDWQPEDPATLADPFAIYARLRDEDPCHWSPRLRSWVLTRYDDVKRACQDREALSSDRLRPFFSTLAARDAERLADVVRYLSLWMVFKDAPQHTRLRRMTGRVFSARTMQGMRPAAQAISARLLQAADGRDEIDLIADYAGPLPCLVIMALLGVPEGEMGRLKRWSDDIALFIGSARTNAQKYATAQAATAAMAAFFRELIDARRREPQSDAISELVHARAGDDDAGEAPFSDDELVATCILMLFAGHETTTNHLANGVLALLRFPRELARLRADPGLAASAVEELLRYDGPSGAQVRIVAQPLALHGKALEPGQRVFLMLNAANRDPRAYPDPDRLNLTRDGVPHLAFGYGAHICLGFPLARTEGAVALPALLERYAHIELAGVAQDSLAWLDSLVFRGVKALPLRVRRA